MQSHEIKYSDHIRFSLQSEFEEMPSNVDWRYSVQLNRDFEGADVRLEHPRDGLSLLLNDYVLQNDVTAPYLVDEGAITITAMLSGEVQNRVCCRAGRHFRMNKPCDMVFISDGYEGEVAIRGKIPVRSVNIYLRKEVFRDMLADSEQFAFAADMVGKTHGLFQLGVFHSSPQTQLIATQILGCRYFGPCRRLFMESKALELMALTLQRLGGKYGPASVSLSQNDIERLYEARRLLMQSMEEPPSLKKLSRMVAMNEFKLKKGFRELFGYSPYQALRNHRLQTARTLLEDSDMTVGTVAAMVGYTNMSHFIAAFKKKFGVTPGGLLNHSRYHFNA